MKYKLNTIIYFLIIIISLGNFSRQASCSNCENDGSGDWRSYYPENLDHPPLHRLQDSSSDDSSSELLELTENFLDHQREMKDSTAKAKSQYLRATLLPNRTIDKVKESRIFNGAKIISFSTPSLPMISAKPSSANRSFSSPPNSPPRKQSHLTTPRNDRNLHPGDSPHRKLFKTQQPRFVKKRPKNQKPRGYQFQL